jgi:hypothetical protein
MWRLEVASPRGERLRSFLHVLNAVPADAAPTAVQRLRGPNLRGAVSRSAQQSAAVVFVGSQKEGQVALGQGVDQVVIAGLEPGQRYAVSVEPTSCNLRLAPSRASTDPVATSGGFLRANGSCKTP